MSFWSKIAGTIESVFQLGLGGPAFKNNSSATTGIDARSSDDTAYVNLRAADPVIDSDLATRRYVDTRYDELAEITRQLIACLAANGIDLPLDLLARIDDSLYSSKLRTDP